MIKDTFFTRLIGLTLFLNTVCAFSQSGVIKGRIIDAESRDPLFGASVILEGTTIGAMADSDGDFSITNIPAGKYRVSSSFISYKTDTTEELVVRSGDTVQIHMELANAYNTLDVVGIKVKVNREAETVLLLDRKKAISAIQNIGSSELSRKGISDAQAAVSSISGISQQNGVKNVFVRGLGDRYNSTLLNGLPIPSEDPEYKNIALSIFESDVIQSINVDKVFSAQTSGDAGGAIIDISSKELHARRALGFQVSGGLNSNIRNKPFYKSDGANYFGFSNGHHPHSESFDFPNRLDPTSVSGIPNYSFRISGGKRFRWKKDEFSIFLVGNHAVENLFTEEIVRNSTDDGTIYQDQNGKKYQIKTNQLILANLNYSFNRKHSLAYNFLMSHGTNQYVGDYQGLHAEKFQDAFQNNGFIRRQQINDNLLLTHQLISDWELNEKLDLNADISVNTIKGKEPDRRENYFSQKENGSYGLTGSNRQKRFFSELQEEEYNLKMNLSYALKDNRESGNSNLSFGYQMRTSNNDFESVEYNFSQMPGSVSIENPMLDELYNQENFQLGLFGISMSNPNNYAVKKQNHAVYVESNYQFSEVFSANFGFRTDFVNLKVQYDVPGQKGENDLTSPYYLPIINLKYEFDEKNHFRLGASKTYTLPQSKEISPFQYVNIGFASEGNPNLKPSDNYNIDFRWDNHLSSSELLSATLFYKRIQNPIGRVDKGNSAGLLTYENISDFADVTGAEIEIRKNIFSAHNEASGTDHKLSVGTNASYILTTTKLKLINTPERNSELEGASPFLLNADITYQYSKNDTNWMTSLFFNYFSTRIHTIGTMGYQDIMEEGAGMLNFISTYRFSNHLSLSLKASNLLDPAMKLTRKIEHTNEKITLNQFYQGLNFNIGLSFDF